MASLRSASHDHQGGFTVLRAGQKLKVPISVLQIGLFDKLI